MSTALSLAAAYAEPTHRVIAPCRRRFCPRPISNRRPADFLPLNAVVRLEQQQGDFFQTDAAALFIYRHLAPLGEHAPDFVAVAERFLGVPYVWGGKTFAGLDCSGLIQTSLQAAGIPAPRDTDMMEKALGLPVGRDDIQRGDLVFWKGHMGVMLDGDACCTPMPFTWKCRRTAGSGRRAHRKNRRAGDVDQTALIAAFHDRPHWPASSPAPAR